MRLSDRRRQMRITVDKRVTWIPDFDENLAQDEGDRIVVSYDKPQAYRRDQWTSVSATRTSTGDLSTRIEKDTRRIILDSNVRIENLVIVEDGHEKFVKTGEELLQSRSAFCSMLVTLLVNRLLSDDWKGELPS